MNAGVAIVGNGVAGTACATRLARHGIEPLLIGRGLPVDRPPLSKAALLDGRARLLCDEARLSERGISRLDGVVTAADLAARILSVRGADGRDVELEAEHLVLATGLHYGVPPVPGLDGAFVNANPHVLERLGPLLTAGPVDVVVVGAGLIGTESAATLAAAGHAVTLVDVLARPLDRLHDPLPALGAETLGELGVHFLGGVRIEGATAHSLETAAHGTLEADVVLVATGGAPLSPPGLPADAELPFRVDADMRVPGYDGVYACGDLVLVPHARFGPMRFPHWDAAIGTGEQVADTIAGEAGPYDRLPYWWSDIGPRRLAEVGHATAVAAWAAEDGLHVGRDAAGAVVCVLVVDEPRRLREARTLVQDGPG